MTIVESYDQREVFSGETRAENAAAEAERTLDRAGDLYFVSRPENEGSRWFFVEARRRFDSALIGYLSP